ncbi:hypothetical protein EDC04DRAFT_3092478 [Pisolithus marmoratus]|nr:hypothetical protein EDC04DRAFT_3092478 [Pisolithus marmoratus]
MNGGRRAGKKAVSRQTAAVLNATKHEVTVEDELSHGQIQGGGGKGGFMAADYFKPRKDEDIKVTDRKQCYDEKRCSVAPLVDKYMASSYLGVEYEMKDLWSKYRKVKHYNALSLVSKLYWIWHVATRIKKIDLATSNTKYYSRTELVEPHSPCPA